MRTKKNEHTVKNVATAWFELKKDSLTPTYAEDIWHSLTLHVFPDHDSQSDPGGRFREALDLLISHILAHPENFVNTAGLQGFRNPHGTRNYPDLGVKKTSNQAHIKSISGW